MTTNLCPGNRLRYRITGTVSLGQSFGQRSDQILPIPCPFLPALQFHHDFAADKPVRHDHVVVYGADHIHAGLFKYRCNAAE